MSTFRPPTDNLLSYTNPLERTGLGYQLFKFAPPEPRGRNVFKLNDNSYVETAPFDPATIVETYHGGHDHEVDATEVAALTAAGYGANIT